MCPLEHENEQTSRPYYVDVKKAHHVAVPKVGHVVASQASSCWLMRICHPQAAAVEHGFIKIILKQHMYKLPESFFHGVQ